MSLTCVWFIKWLHNLYFFIFVRLRNCDEILLEVCRHKLPTEAISLSANIRTCTWINSSEFTSNDLITICAFGVVSIVWLLNMYLLGFHWSIEMCLQRRLIIYRCSSIWFSKTSTEKYKRSSDSNRYSCRRYLARAYQQFMYFYQ